LYLVEVKLPFGDASSGAAGGGGVMPGACLKRASRAKNY